MNSTQAYIARLLFRNKVLSLSGNGFEDFFSSIMFKYDSRFIQIKPQGSYGDRKNDGFIKEEGIYYQVYSPENPTESDGKGAKKAIEDFTGLYNYWNDKCKIKKFFFVFNDKFKGTYPETQAGILELAGKFTDVEFNILHSHFLEDIFSGLKEDDIISVVSFIPDTENITLDYSALSEVIDGLSNGIIDNYEDKLKVPDFDKKIAFNGLSENIKKMLVKGGYEIGLLEEYFNKTYNKTLRTFIKEVLKKYYDEGKGLLLEGDDLFMYVNQKCKDGKKQSNSIFNAILVLMSYYFDSCDIFEEPN